MPNTPFLTIHALCYICPALLPSNTCWLEKWALSLYLFGYSIQHTAVYDSTSLYESLYAPSSALRGAYIAFPTCLALARGGTRLRRKLVHGSSALVEIQGRPFPRSTCQLSFPEGCKGAGKKNKGERIERPFSCSSTARRTVPLLFTPRSTRSLTRSLCSVLLACFSGFQRSAPTTSVGVHLQRPTL